MHSTFSKISLRHKLSPLLRTVSLIVGQSNHKIRPSSIMMISKKYERGIIMEQRLIATRQTVAENGNLLILQYFLLKERFPSRKQNFGVMIRERNSGEKALASNLSTSVVQVFRLIRRLADCTVTPTALADVLADWEGTL